MRLFLEPTEPLLFRTGRPFDAGESGFAETLFPPTPETMQGAVRTAIASYWDSSKTIEEVFNDPDLTNLIGSRKLGYGRFRITGLSLGRRRGDGKIERLFPAPAHLLTIDNKRDKPDRLLLKPQKLGYMRCSDLAENSYYLFPKEALEPEGKREPFEDWLTESGLEKVLRSHLQLEEDEIAPEEKILSRESRLGIGMDNARKTTKEGLLYQTQVIRLQPDYGFVVDIRLRDPAKELDTPYFESFVEDDQTQRLLKLHDGGWVMLGGERRMARFEVLPTTTSTLEKKRGKLLYLATPAALDGGWLPDTFSTPPITAAIDHYKSIGGWELNPTNAGGNSKTMRRCVPAGSVYFFENPVEVTQPLTNYGMEIGYGITYAGEW
jgi:CRISPR-associated protein Cmr3